MAVRAADFASFARSLKNLSLRETLCALRETLCPMAACWLAEYAPKLARSLLGVTYVTRALTGYDPVGADAPGHATRGQLL